MDLLCRQNVDDPIIRQQARHLERAAIGDVATCQVGRDRIEIGMNPLVLDGCPQSRFATLARLRIYLPFRLRSNGVL